MIGGCFRHPRAYGCGELTNLHHNVRFPGAQPVSFGLRDLDKLEAQEYVANLSSKASLISDRACTIASGFVKSQTASEYSSL